MKDLKWTFNFNNKNNTNLYRGTRNIALLKDSYYKLYIKAEMKLSIKIFNTIVINCKIFHYKNTHISQYTKCHWNYNMKNFTTNSF